MKRFIKSVVLTLVVLGIVGAGAAWYLRLDNADVVSYRTAEVTRGDLLITIDATGTVEPEEVIDIGAQIAGQIVSFGKDVNAKPVDYGSSVEEETILARIDDTLYAATEAEARAQVQYATASILSARAALEEMKAKLHQAGRDWKRAQKLGPSEALAQASYDAYQSAYETARANADSGGSRHPAEEGQFGAGGGGPSAGEEKPGVLHHQVACQGRHHRPPGQYRSDGSGEPERPQSLSDRQGSYPHAGLGGGQ